MISNFAPGVGGTILRRAELEHFTVSEAVYRGGHTPMHAHERPLLSFSIDGRFRATVEAESWQCDRHNLRLLPVGARHEEIYDCGATRSLLVEIDPRGFGDEPDISEALRVPEQFAPGTMAAVARAADVHPASLSRAFRRHLGTTPGEYQRRLRLEWAKEQIRRGSWSLGRVAIEAGFSDHAHFTRSFRALFAMNPSHYRAVFTSEKAQ